MLFTRIEKIFATSQGMFRYKEVVYVVSIFLEHSSHYPLLSPYLNAAYHLSFLATEMVPKKRSCKYKVLTRHGLGDSANLRAAKLQRL